MWRMGPAKRPDLRTALKLQTKGSTATIIIPTEASDGMAVIPPAMCLQDAGFASAQQIVKYKGA